MGLPEFPPTAATLPKPLVVLSLALEPMLWEAAGKDPRIHLGDIPPPPSRQKLNRLDGELSRLRRLLSKIQEGFEAGVYTAEEAKRRLEPLRTDEERLTAERDAEQADLLAENDVAELRARQQLQADVHAIVSHPEFRNSITWRRKFVELVVREVIVDLETGEFEAHTRFQDEPLRRLAGELVRDPNPLSGQNATYPTPASHR